MNIRFGRAGRYGPAWLIAVVGGAAILSWMLPPAATGGEPESEVRAMMPGEPGIVFADGVAFDPETEILVVRSAGVGSTPILTDHEPGRGSAPYVVRGEARAAGIGSAEAYLELWNVFAPSGAGAAEARYFTRTLSKRGAMRRLADRDGWRAFELPFLPSPESGAPIRLELSAVLPPGGLVELRAVRLEAYDRVAGSLDSQQQRRLHLIGAVLGPFTGLAGALIGIGSGRRRFRGLATAGFVAMGLAAVLFGGAAIWAARHAAWSLVGLYAGGAVLATVLLAYGRRRLAQQQIEADYRRMRAADA